MSAATKTKAKVIHLLALFIKRISSMHQMNKG